MVHYKRGLKCLNALLFCVYTESSIFDVLILYMLIHTFVGGRICSRFVEQGLYVVLRFLLDLQFIDTVRLKLRG